MCGVDFHTEIMYTNSKEVPYYAQKFRNDS